MPQYELAFNEAQELGESYSWLVGKQLVLNVDYDYTMQLPENLRFRFDFEPAGMYTTVVILV